MAAHQRSIWLIWRYEEQNLGKTYLFSYHFKTEGKLEWIHYMIHMVALTGHWIENNKDLYT